MKWRSLDESGTELDLRSLRDQFAERKQLIAKYALPETQAIHARAIAEIRASGIVRGALAFGSQAPPFELQDHNGVNVSSAKLLEKTSVAICFFRGRWCPFCVGQLEAMNLLLPQILTKPAQRSSPYRHKPCSSRFSWLINTSCAFLC